MLQEGKRPGGDPEAIDGGDRTHSAQIVHLRTPQEKETKEQEQQQLLCSDRGNKDDSALLLADR